MNAWVDHGDLAGGLIGKTLSSQKTTPWFLVPESQAGPCVGEGQAPQAAPLCLSFPSQVLAQHGAPQAGEIPQARPLLATLVGGQSHPWRPSAGGEPSVSPLASWEGSDQACEGHRGKGAWPARPRLPLMCWGPQARARPLCTRFPHFWENGGGAGAWP